MRYNNTRRLERYSNGKEPHWKCGVPQGIVRSSRILSAKGQTSVWPFSYSVVLLAFLPIPYYNEKQAVSAVVLHSAHGN